MYRNPYAYGLWCLLTGIALGYSLQATFLYFQFGWWYFHTAHCVWSVLSIWRLHWLIQVVRAWTLRGVGHECEEGLLFFSLASPPKRPEARRENSNPDRSRVTYR